MTAAERDTCFSREELCMIIGLFHFRFIALNMRTEGNMQHSMGNRFLFIWEM